MKIYLRLLKFLQPYIWPYLILAALCMLGYSASSGALPFLTKGIFDDVFASKDANVLGYLPFVIVGIFLFRGLVSLGQDNLMAYISGRVVTDIRNKLSAHTLSLSLSFFQRHQTGALMSRMTGDVGVAAGSMTDAVVSVIRESTQLIALVSAAFYMDTRLALISFLVFPASVLPVLRLGKKIRKYTRRSQEKVGLLLSLLQETIQGNRIVKAFGMESYEQDRFVKESERLFKIGIRTTRIRSVVGPIMELFSAFAIGGVVWYGGASVIAGTRTQGQFMAFLTAMFMMYQPFKKLANTNGTILTGIAAGERVFEILDTDTDVREKLDARSAVPFSKQVEFHDASFGYGHKMVLKNIDLTINAGNMIALVGMSGVGKSTLADLIPRFYDVLSGKITLDGVDIRDLTLESLRAQIGVVTQNTFLFNDSVKNNIAYGDRSKDMDHIIAAAHAAHAHDFITALPQGYDTVIGELGLKLSGGERQRLSIARALLKDPPILILDEATSALDSESEKLVQDALERLMVGRTSLVIAHRLSTIRKADRIVVLVDGMIVEQGTHDELLAQKAEYNKLYTLQFTDQSDELEQEKVLQ
ncbi:MAG: ATP-binding cassette domain-containing protein [Deltaproteobacteria bacterium]|nr:ATP-binding cassette domain-containing protein [Deltaproteobacteria bacterium]